MIKAAIVAHPEEARAGLSRPALKKWIHAKYPHTSKVSEGLFSSNLSRAIATGEDKKLFVLPKGPSGKIKLAPGAKPKAAKPKDEAQKPATKKPAAKAAPKKAAAPKKPSAKKPATKAAAPKKASTTTKKVCFFLCGRVTRESCCY